MAILMILASLLVLVVGTMNPVPMGSVGLMDLIWMLGSVSVVVFLAKIFFRTGKKTTIAF